MYLKIALNSLLPGQPEFCLIFILSKNSDFQSRVLLKMALSSLFIEEFDLGIQKWRSLKEAKAYLSINNKNILQNVGFKGNFKYNGAVYFTEYSL